MIILYILLIAYILAINFYAFLLVKSFRDKEREAERSRNFAMPLAEVSETSVLSENENGETDESDKRTSVQTEKTSYRKTAPTAQTSPPPEKFMGKLCITGLLGGAITVYVSMFLLKFQRNNLLLMVLMPLLGVLNVYVWVLLFRSGFSFLLIR